jgi:acyl-CoA thioesterase I
LTPFGSAGVQFVPPAPGAYVIRISVSDGALVSTADVSVNVVAASVVRLLQLGDSITQGYGGQQSYRYPLWRKLVDAGARIDAVGSTSQAAAGSPSWPDYKGQRFDLDHEGHSGWTADAVAGALPSWLTGYTPDIALIHLGSNDLLHRNGDVDGALLGLSRAVAHLRTANPNVRLYVALIIPISSAWSAVASAAVGDLNNRLSAWAASLTSQRSPLRLVDQYTGFNVDADTYDGVHPNSRGEEKMAQRWFDAMAGEF